MVGFRERKRLEQMNKRLEVSMAELKNENHTLAAQKEEIKTEKVLF